MTVEHSQSQAAHAMSQVNVTINGRQFRLACEPGQEAHMTDLATDLDKRIEELRARFGEIGDTRLTVMAALALADDLAGLGERLRHLEAEFAALQDARAASAEHSQATQAAIVAAFNSAAERIESVTRQLNQTVGESGVAMG
jgi:cell division protein ZapA